MAYTAAATINAISDGSFQHTYAHTDDQYKLYEKGNYNDVNVIIGTNSDEGSMFSRPDG